LCDCFCLHHKAGRISAAFRSEADRKGHRYGRTGHQRI
jgi:hypothetical protein